MSGGTVSARSSTAGGTSQTMHTIDKLVNAIIKIQPLVPKVLIGCVVIIGGVIGLFTAYLKINQASCVGLAQAAEFRSGLKFGGYLVSPDGKYIVAWRNGSYTCNATAFMVWTCDGAQLFEHSSGAFDVLGWQTDGRLRVRYYGGVCGVRLLEENLLYLFDPQTREWLSQPESVVLIAYSGNSIDRGDDVSAYYGLSVEELSSLLSKGQSDITSLRIYGDQLVELPPEIYALPNLTELYIIGYKQPKTLSPQINQLTNLTVLDLRRNHLTDLPIEIWQLTRLKKLNLGGNQLTSLPPEVSQLTNLMELNFGGNQLTTLPPEIGQLTRLTKLTLGQNQVEKLPPEIGQLTNLAELDLGENQLTTLPSEIGQLENLKSLALRNNRLRILPSGIGQLTNLVSLDMGGNPLETQH